MPRTARFLIETEFRPGRRHVAHAWRLTVPALAEAEGRLPVTARRVCSSREHQGADGRARAFEEARGAVVRYHQASTGTEPTVFGDLETAVVDMALVQDGTWEIVGAPADGIVALATAAPEPRVFRSGPDGDVVYMGEEPCFAPTP